ncbi:MAG: glycosyltransferase family 39 protein [Planctomycetes bacterium]|nr:glycosyltransferase family 39 protein [Planctomycetota bacterium]
MQVFEAYHGASALLGDDARRERRSSRFLALGLALFVLAALPLCADLARYHGDERFYTDAALGMERSGDWLTPRYADGGERWNKPLAAYWIIAGALRLFGHAPFAARLPFLIAGGFTLWFTARAARVLFDDPRAALLAAFALGSSAEFLQLATRSTPDALLAAGIAASLAGAAELVFSERPGRGAAWAFLGGAGFALVAKGALGLLAPAFAFAWILARRGRAGAREALRPGALGLFLLLAVAALLPMLLRGGEQGLARALDDQVGARAATSAAMVLDNLATYARCLVQHLLPWSVLGALAFLFPSARDWARSRRAQLGFALGWYLALLFLFSLANLQRARYLFPGYPMVAAVLAALVCGAFAEGRSARVLRRFAVVLASLVLLASVALLLGTQKVGAASVEGLLAVLVAVAGLGLAVRVDGALAAPAAALALCVAQPLGERALHAAFDASPAEALAERLEELGARGGAVACVGGEAKIASQLRLLSAGRLDPTWSLGLEDAELAGVHWLVLAPEAARALAPEPRAEAALAPRAVAARDDCGFEYPRGRPADERAVLSSDDAGAALRERREAWVLVTLAAEPVRASR